MKHISRKLLKKDSFTKDRFSKTNIAVFALIFACIGIYSIFHGSAASDAFCDNLPAWTGNGSTTTVSPGQSIQTAVNSTPAGGTVDLLDGDYGQQSVTINKAIRLKAHNQYGALLHGSQPSSANAGGAGTAVSISGAGAMIDGLDIRYYSVGINVDNGGPLTIQRNRVVSMQDAGIQIYDARQPLVQCNDIRDPYLPNDPVSQNPASPPNISDAQTDYGLNFYGTTEPKALHNYFFGIFNQTLSFKEGNRNPTASFNTFEGSKLTALFFGQNGPHNGPYDYAGLPTGPDFGTLTAEGNVFRQVKDSRGVYYLRTPIRVWHVNGGVVIKNNVVESAEQGILLECRTDGTDPGCLQGTVTLTGNTIGGAVTYNSSRVQVNGTGCILAYPGVAPPRVTTTMTNTACVSTPTVIDVSSGGWSGGGPTISQSGTQTVSNPITSLRLAPVAAFDPDLSYSQTGSISPPPPPPPVPKLGDLNADGQVNIFDVSILLGNYGKTKAASSNPLCDINNDNIVNIFDVSILLGNYGK